MIRIFNRLGGAAFFAAVFVLTCRLEYAEALSRGDSPQAVRRAIGLDRLAPPAPYFERLEEWKGALQADPRLTSARIARGLEQERTGRFDQARSDLLEAARLDREYLPAWTLANFFFRRDDRENFWVWARRAADLCYDDPRPLLALAHRVEPEPEQALSRLGGGPKLERADLDYLATQGRMDAAQGVARRLRSRADPADAPRWNELAARQLAAGNVAYALEFWMPPLDPARGKILTNGDFKRAPSGQGFDWRLGPADCATPHWRDGALTLYLSGDQPESCPLLEQTLPSAAQAHAYRLRISYATGVEAGLHWEFGGTDLGQPASGEAVLVKPPRAGPLTTLRLFYRRDPGAVRAQGRVELRSVSVEVD